MRMWTRLVTPPVLGPTIAQGILMTQLVPIDRFTILDGIGRGGYGKVYAAVDTVASELVAMKTQSKESPEAIRELEAYLALPTHANVLHLHGFFLSTTGGTQNINIVFKHHNSSPVSYTHLTLPTILRV